METLYDSFISDLSNHVAFDLNQVWDEMCGWHKKWIVPNQPEQMRCILKKQPFSREERNKNKRIS